MNSPESYTVEEARELVEQAKEENQVIQLHNVGATPYLKYSPYQNNRGSIVHMWSCISMTPKAMPKETLLFSWPHIIDPSERDDFAVNHLSTEWVINEVRKRYKAKVDLVDIEESPFAGGLMEWRKSE